MTPPTQPSYPTQPQQGPYYPPPPPQPQPPHPPRKPSKTMGCWQIGALVLLAWWIGSALVGGIGFLAFTVRTHSSAQATATATNSSPDSYVTWSTAVPGTPSPSPRPTKPAPTDTPEPAAPEALSGPVLGGSPGDFQSTYGDPSSADAWYTTVAGQEVQLSIAVTGADVTTDGAPHVYDIAVQPAAGSSWTRATAERIAAAFLPPDAAYQRDVTGRNGAINRIYQSPSLAATFTRAYFTDYAQTPGRLACILVPGSGGITTGVAMIEVVAGA